MPERRAVITGIGCVSPVGLCVEDTWDALLAGRSGVKPIELWDTSGHSVHIAGEITDFDPTSAAPAKEVKRWDRFTQLGVAAAKEAMEDSGFVASDEIAHRCGVITGSGIGGLLEIERQHTRFMNKGVGRISPFLIPKLMLNALSGQISMIYNLKGVNFATASACASSGHAMAMALRSIRCGESDVVVTGGSEAAITNLGVGGFANMKALSTRNDDPEAASRPFDRDRDGFVMGEGAGILVLEELEHARKRGARIYCELAGAGMTADSHHITQPAPEARGAQESMRLALKEAGVAPDEVDYINAHGTSTPLNDLNESLAIEAVFGSHAQKLSVNSSKSMIGHLLGGSSCVEGVVCAMSMERGVVHETKNHDTPGEGCNLDYVKGAARDLEVKIALSNSLGFGGHNLTLAFRKI